MQKRLMSPQAEAHAESSTTAAKRARLASAERDLPLAKVNGVKKGEGKDEGLVVSGKRARKQIQTLDFNEFDDLESISDGDQENRRDRVNAKAGKGVNGKSKRLSRCLPQCPELIHSGTTEKKGRWRLLRQNCRRTEGPTSLVQSLTHKHILIAGPKTLNDTQLRKELKGKDRERQYGPCLRPRYKGWGKCTQCVAKMSGDSCRFRNFRMFK